MTRTPIHIFACCLIVSVAAAACGPAVTYKPVDPTDTRPPMELADVKILEDGEVPGPGYETIGELFVENEVSCNTTMTTSKEGAKVIIDDYVKQHHKLSDLTAQEVVEEMAENGDLPQGKACKVLPVFPQIPEKEEILVAMIKSLNETALVQGASDAGGEVVYEIEHEVFKTRKKPTFGGAGTVSPEIIVNIKTSAKVISPKKEEVPAYKYDDDDEFEDEDEDDEDEGEDDEEKVLAKKDDTEKADKQDDEDDGEKIEDEDDGEDDKPVLKTTSGSTDKEEELVVVKTEDPKKIKKEKAEAKKKADAETKAKQAAEEAAKAAKEAEIAAKKAAKAAKAAEEAAAKADAIQKKKDAAKKKKEEEEAKKQAAIEAKKKKKAEAAAKKKAEEEAKKAAIAEKKKKKAEAAAKKKAEEEAKKEAAKKKKEEAAKKKAEEEAKKNGDVEEEDDISEETIDEAKDVVGGWKKEIYSCLHKSPELEDNIAKLTIYIDTAGALDAISISPGPAKEAHGCLMNTLGDLDFPEAGVMYQFVKKYKVKAK